MSTLEKGWKTLLPSVKVADSIDTVSNPGSKVQPCVPFSRGPVSDHLVDFIVVNDPVGTLCCGLYHADFFPWSTNVVECPAFRKLLHLRPELQDNDIPR